jgi:hypothetical protein
MSHRVSPSLISPPDQITLKMESYLDLGCFQRYFVVVNVNFGDQHHRSKSLGSTQPPCSARPCLASHPCCIITRTSYRLSIRALHALLPMPSLHCHAPARPGLPRKTRTESGHARQELDTAARGLGVRTMQT